MMAMMSRHEEFTVEVDDASIEGRLDLPPGAASTEPAGVVMLCRGLPALNSQSGELLEQITAAFVEAELAVATFGPRSTGASAPRLTPESIDDASAVFRWLALRDDLDLNRIGVLGYGLGSIIAACLSKRTDLISRLCLLSPVTMDEVTTRLTNGNGEELAACLGCEEIPPGFFEDLEALHPAEDLAFHDRPTMIMHAAADQVVSPESSLLYRDAIEVAGHQIQHVLVALADHTFSPPAARSACLDQLANFFVSMRAPAGSAAR